MDIMKYPLITSLLLGLGLLAASCFHGPQGVLPTVSTTSSQVVALTSQPVPVRLPTVRFVTGWPPITTVVENIPHSQFWGKYAGCQAYDTKDRGPNLPFTYAAPLAPPACPEGFTAFAVSNQPWNTIVTCLLDVFMDGTHQLIQSPDTACTVEGDPLYPGGLLVTYWLAKYVAPNAPEVPVPLGEQPPFLRR